MESKLAYFFSAFLVSIAAALAANQGAYPGNWQMIVFVVGGLAQGALAWRAFVAQPPKKED